MAMATSAANLAQCLHIEAILSIPPQKITADPRPTRCVSVTNPGQLARSGIFKRSLNVILCYNKSTEEDTGYMVAGWIKESLGEAISEQPMLSGRFLVPGGESSEVVANDSGVRLIEGSISMSLEEFLINTKERNDVEGMLVFWKDIDEENPHFSPLVYVQVTNFECGGYSIGISCSILLADLLMMSNFLETWSKIHKNLMSQNGVNKLPLFYFHDHEKKSMFMPTILINSNERIKHSSPTIIFKIPTENPFESYKNLALLAIKKAEKQIGSELGQEVSMFVQESANTIKIESYEKDEVVGMMSPKNELLNARWGELEEIGFYKKNKPAYVSHWIGSRHGDGEDEFVIALASPEKKRSLENNFIFILLNHKSDFGVI